MADNYKVIQGIPGWDDIVLQGDEATDTAAAAYETVPLLYRAVKLRCDSLVSIPVYVRDIRTEKEKSWPFKEIGLSDFLWRTEAASLLSGKATWLKILSGANKVINLQWLNPLTVTVKYKDGTTSFTQSISGKPGQTWMAEEIVYFREWTLRNDIGEGKGAAQVALGNSKLLDYMERFPEQFFRSGVMPTVLLTIDGNPAKEDMEKAEKWFRRATTTIQNAFRVLALRGKWTTSILTPPLKDLAMPELTYQARLAIANAFGIPPTMLADAANYATAKEHRLSFWQDTIRPRVTEIEYITNKQLFNPMGLTLNFAMDEMDIFQEDEAQRSQSYASYVSSGMKPSIAAQLLGLDLPEGMEYEDLDTGGLPAEFTEAGQSMMRIDLDKWQRKASNRLKANKTALCTFASEHIPPTLAAAIEGALEVAETPEQLAVIFAWQGYP